LFIPKLKARFREKCNPVGKNRNLEIEESNLEE